LLFAWAALAPLAAEQLRYAVKLPTGFVLGDGLLSATREGADHLFHLSIDASFPGFPIRDQFSSRASGTLCSLRFEKDSTHGPRTAREVSTFDWARGVVVRQTVGGGKSESAAPACARDVLTFLFLLRRELAEGRLPPPQMVFFGAQYDIRIARLGPNRVSATLKGPASENVLDIQFADDAARTPVLIQVPVSFGTFTMELVR
jgi:hypothetical protein